MQDDPKILDLKEFKELIKYLVISYINIGKEHEYFHQFGKASNSYEKATHSGT